jgi:hypothetical protein
MYTKLAALIPTFKIISISTSQLPNPVTLAKQTFISSSQLMGLSCPKTDPHCSGDNGIGDSLPPAELQQQISPCQKYSWRKTE